METKLNLRIYFTFLLSCLSTISFSEDNKYHILLISDDAKAVEIKASEKSKVWKTKLKPDNQNYNHLLGKRNLIKESTYGKQFEKWETIDLDLFIFNLYYNKLEVIQKEFPKISKRMILDLQKIIKEGK